MPCRTELRRLRRDREKTLSDVRIATGVSETSLSMIERGLQPPNPDQAEALAGYFGRPIEELLAPAPEAA